MDTFNSTYAVQYVELELARKFGKVELEFELGVPHLQTVAATAGSLSEQMNAIHVYTSSTSLCQSLPYRKVESFPPSSTLGVNHILHESQD